MDLRIVNTCDSDCMYCLEQDVRKEIPYIPISIILNTLERNQEREILSFYGGNPILHPEIHTIIQKAKALGYKNISILTNGHILTMTTTEKLKKSGLNSISLYFHSMVEEIHETIVQEPENTLKKLLRNIQNLQEHNMLGKLIIHTHKLNIAFLGRDIVILHKKFGVSRFELLNYYPFSRAYDEYHQTLYYDINKVTQYIEKLFVSIKEHNIQVRFLKFPKAFFVGHYEYYEHELFMSYIDKEDEKRLKQVGYINEREA